MAETKQAEQAPVVASVNPSVIEIAQAVAIALQNNQAANNAELAATIADAARAAAPPRQLTFDEYSPVSPFNPKGTKGRELPFPVYQNGVRLHSDTLHDEEFALLPKLRPGRFCAGLVTIAETERGGQRHVRIDYANETQDQRIALKNEVRNFTDMLKRCVAESQALVAA